MAAHIKKGYGFHVDYDFTRATRDIPITIDPDAYAKPGNVVGIIAGDPDSPLGFMRRDKIRVHVTKAAIINAD